MKLGLEEVCPQQLWSCPQVQLVSVPSNNVLHVHGTHAYSVFAVLGDTRVVSVDTDVESDLVTGSLPQLLQDTATPHLPQRASHLLFQLPNHPCSPLTPPSKLHLAPALGIAPRADHLLGATPLGTASPAPDTSTGLLRDHKVQQVGQVELSAAVDGTVHLPRAGGDT